MAMISIPIPQDVSEYLRQIDVPDVKKRDSSDHLTLFYLGDNIPLDTINDAIEACITITEKQKPFLIDVNGYSCFPKGEKVPVVCRVKNQEIFDLREDLKKRLDKLNVEYSKKFPTFKPHITLSYNDEKVPSKKFPKICWQVNKLAIYGGDEGKQKIFVELPFGGGMKKSAVYLNKLAEQFLKRANEG